MTPPSTPQVGAVRIAATADAHRDAHPRKKVAAADHGVHQRTEGRWGRRPDAKGSPLHRYSEYLDTAQNPWRLLAHNYSRVMGRAHEDWTREQIVARIQELHVESCLTEGEDKANRARRGLSHLDRARDAERVATHQLELSALWRRAAELKISESEILGGRQ